tara:strand:- start:1870 stop:2766 length:897 start_codon:yes stop_codon:yes gene_type:complete
MIANEGYVPLSLMYEQNYSELTDGARSYLEGTKNTLMSLCINRADDISTAWLFEFCGSDLYLTDGVNAPVRIDPGLVRFGHYFIDLSEGVLSHENEPTPHVDSELRTTFNFCEPLQASVIDEFNSAVDLCSDEGNELCAKIFATEVRKLGMTRPLLFVEDRTYRINFNLYRVFSDFKREDAQRQTFQDVDRYADILAPFEGRFLSVPTPLAEQGWDAFCRSIGERKIKEHDRMLELGEESKGPRSGRPRKREAAYSVYMSLFPKGHGSLTWDQVEVAVSKEFGSPVSAQTIKAAMKSN